MAMYMCKINGDVYYWIYSEIYQYIIWSVIDDVIFQICVEFESYPL